MANAVTRQYFGTDGIRGTVGVAPITPDFMLHLGAAAGRVLTRQLTQTAAGQSTPRVDERRGKRPQVLIGKDTRVSGYMMESALEAGFASVGVDVILCGPLSTPGVAYLTRALRLSAGVVISASHNPYADNGIKFFAHDGGKLPDQAELQIEAVLNRQLGQANANDGVLLEGWQIESGLPCVSSAAIGKARRLEDAAGRYIEFCKSSFPSDCDLRGLRLVVDCAQGAAYHTAPAVLHELGASVVAVGNTPDGFNINDQVGATHPEHIRACVIAEGADLGIALDGDADRVLIVDGEGRIFSGDELLYVLAMDRLAHGGIAGAVGTLMTNLAVEHALQAAGIAFTRAKVGDRYVLETLHARGWQLGGEGSGHIICLDKHTTGDGTISALQVLAAMKRQGKSLAQMLAGLNLYPQTLLNVRVAKDFDWRSKPAVVAAAQAAEQQLGARGRVLIRPSGTEPLVRVMVEAQDAAESERCAQSIAAALREAVGLTAGADASAMHS